MTFHKRVAAFKADLIESTLAECGGSRTVAAELLGLSRSYLSRLVHDLGVPGAAGKPGDPGHLIAQKARAQSHGTVVYESPQDAVLEAHFVHFVRGAGQEYGAAAADELARIMRRARQEYGLTFGGLVARLLQAEGRANGW